MRPTRIECAGFLHGNPVYQELYPQNSGMIVSGGMKLVFFRRFESHVDGVGFYSEATAKEVLLQAVDFLPS